MIITLHTQRILDEVRRKVYFEVKPIQEPEARHDARVDEEKSYELGRSLLDSDAALQSLVMRFIRHDETVETCDAPNIPEMFTYEFAFTERRMKGKLPALTETMHDYLVNETLARHFNTVTQTQLSDRHAALAEVCAKRITEMLFTKNPPIV